MLPQVFLESLARIVAAEGEVEEAFGILDPVADVVAAGLPDQRVHRLPLGQQVHRVGELDLAADALARLVEAVEDLGGKDVAPGDGQVARRLLDDEA